MKKWLILFMMFLAVLAACDDDEGKNTESRNVNGSEVELSKKDTNEKEKESESKAVSDEPVAQIDNTEANEVENSKNDNTTSETVKESKDELTNKKEMGEIEEIDLNFVKEQLKIGMTEKEIINLLGKPDAIGKAALDRSPVWRYDIGAPDDYESETNNSLGEEFIDIIDAKGIENGTLKMQLSIGWLEGKVKHVANSYLENGESVTYHLLGDGTIKYDK